MAGESSIKVILEELAACLCSALGQDASCYCGIIFGPQLVPVEFHSDDSACTACAAGYVRLDQAYPSVDFPAQSDQATCRTVLAFPVSVGIQRCAPLGDDRGNPPTLEEQEDYARRAIDDMELIRSAIRCCLTDDKFEGIQYVMSNFVPLPVEGGVGGGEWRLTIQELF